MINKEILTKTFSRIAARYDAYASVQSRIACRLAQAIAPAAPRSILEIGCGTGNFTASLRRRFPRARLVAVDISTDMIDVARSKPLARGVEFKTVDAEMLRLRERFDLIASNAAFQWFGDLPAALRRFKGLLAPGGALYFSTFGPETFYELRGSLRLFDGERYVAAEQFLDKAALRRALEEGFIKSGIEEKRLIVIFGTLRELLTHIRYTSGVNNGVKKIWTPRVLRSLEEIYRKKYKRIAATYQVFICRAQ